MDVHLYGPTVATVCGISTEKGKDKDGKEFTRSYGWVDTWMERNGKWGYDRRLRYAAAEEIRRGVTSREK